MFEAAETDKIVRQKESAEEFQNSSVLFREADKLRYQDRQQAEAETKYREAMEATGDYGVYYHLAQGQIYSMRGNLEYALTEFETAAEINEQAPPEHQVSAVYINLGLTYRKLSGRYSSLNLGDKAEEMLKESIDAGEQALKISPEDTGTLNTLAKTYLKMGKEYLEKAQDYSQKAYDVDSESYEALCGLAQVRRSQGRKEEAKSLAEDAVALRPNQPFAYGILGGWRDKKERLENSPKVAIEWLKKGNALEPDNTFMLSELGKACRELGEHEKAVEYFEEAVRKDAEGEQQYGSLTNRGNAYRLAGNKELDASRKADYFTLAETDLKKALSIRPDFNPALIGLRDLYEAQNRYEESYGVAGKLNLSIEQNKRAFDRLERFYKEASRESERITQEIIKQQNRLSAKEAQGKAEKALHLDSQNSDAWWLAGRCLIAGGDYQEARRYFEQAVTLNPRRYNYREAFGGVLEKLGDWQAAEREYNFLTASPVWQEKGEVGLSRVREHLRRDERRRKISTAAVGAGPEIVFLNNKTGRTERHPVETIRNFLYDRMNDWNLPIKDIIEEIGGEPVFIIAKTGVGKTVTVPTKVLLGLCDDLLKRNFDLVRKFPQVYVVEPRIPICTMMMAEMNDGYQDYLAYKLIDDSEFCDFLISEGIDDPQSKEPQTIEKIVGLAYEYASQGKAAYNPRHFNLYGCITSAGKINGDAPILFITTGIMESLTFDGGDKLKPDYHRIIIDEAHVTIEANPAIELGIALARKKGVKIDYMSATVDEGNLVDDLGVKIVRAGKPRFPIHLTNLKAPVEDCVLDLVQNYLLEPDATRFPNPNDFDAETHGKIEQIRLHLLSQEDFIDDGKFYPGLKNRAQGMLIIVNSHQNENSDTQRIANLITRADFNRGKTKVHALRLASEIVRDPSRKLAFDRLVKNIEDQNGRYVIVATNVVEMGLTFSSLDYVITMDSEFDNEYVDGSQMIRKVELGINALYQRIGRAGRVRPGMAFIAKDFGAWYSEIDDATLARGLAEAPIKYPLAKGSFLKLALHTFREGIAENDLRQKIEELNLPSKIQDNSVLWSRFLAERERLRRIGIADGDRLTRTGRKTFDFVGLEDMDFANLLASVIERADEKGSLPIIFTVFAATSELGFNDFMDKKFFLSNPKQLSALEIIHEDALGISVERAYEIIRQNENNPRRLFESLRDEEVDEQICGDIRSFAEAGYKLVGKKELERNFQCSSEGIEEESDYFEDGDVAAIEMDDKWNDEAENQEIELPDEVKAYLDHGSTERTLAFERAVVGFSDQSEIINTYRIFSYFYNHYFSRLNFGAVGSLEASEIRQTMSEEASKLQLNAKTLNSLNERFKQLLRHVGIKFRGGTRSLATEVEFNEKDGQILRDVIIKELLFERDRDDERFDLCRKFFDLVERRKNISRNDYETIVGKLTDYGFTVTPDEVGELWNLIIKEARLRFESEIRRFEFVEYPAQLPFISRGLEKRILEILRDSDHHHKLTFTKSNFGFATEVKDQSGELIKVVLPDENTPLEPALDGRETVAAFAKLTPRLVEKDVRDDGDFTKKQEKIFTVSHVTLLI